LLDSASYTNYCIFHLIITAADSNEDEEFFDFDIQSTRRYFPPSFEFKQIDVKGKVK